MSHSPHLHESRAPRAQGEAARPAGVDVLATLGHELRTPLTAILGYGELLADGITGPVSEAQVGQLNRIQASALQLLGLIDEVLTHARLEAGSETVRRERVEVGAALARAAEEAAPLAAAKGLALEVAPPAGAISLTTDAAKLQTILAKLLSNACKFSESGRVRLAARAEGGWAAISVSDDGIGIPPDQLERVFEPFTQVDSSITRRFGGTGLGLSVSRRLARLLGGEVRVESALGRGSTFTLTLPH